LIVWNRGLRSLIIVIALVFVAASVGAQPAAATLQLLKPSPTDPATFAGMGGYSADALGQDGTGGTVQAEVPAGSTVVQAYLYGSYFFTLGGPSLADRTIDFDGSIVELQTLPNSEPGDGLLYTARADVTTQVATKVGAGGGITDFAVNSDPAFLDGVALVVIFSNATMPEVTIAVLDGGSKQAGDQVTFNFASPIDPSATGFSAILSLGSGFSFQEGSVDPHDCTPNQFSIVEVNGSPLTACAGNWDDGYPSNGGLITVGGVGDSTDNPADPVGQTGTDDELYNLVPFMSVGDTQLVIDTENPSADDNLFLAIIQVTAEATVTTEICDNGVDDDGDGLIDAADPDCETGPPPTETSVSGAKYYDANANGQLDAGEAGLADWPIDYDDGTTSASVLTGADGTFSVTLAAGDYTFAERVAGSPWFQTGNSVDQSAGSADVTLNADMTYSVSLEAGDTATGLNFGNLCVGAGGGRTIGFWGNKNGQALIGADDLALLSGLNLVNRNGSAFDPTTASQVRSWLRSATGVNMAYMLSAQLAAMALNVHNGLVAGDALVYAPDTTSANAAGFASISDLMAEANAELALHPTAVSGDAWRSYQADLKNALDDANNNLSFVQADASTCPAPFVEASFDLYADGSVSCVGADDTTRIAGSVTFVESVGQVLFTVSLDGAAPNASYTLAISEEPTCANAVFFPDAIATDGSGDGGFSGSFAKAGGTYNLLVNLVTSPIPSDPTNREIATVDTAVVVH